VRGGVNEPLGDRRARYAITVYSIGCPARLANRTEVGVRGHERYSWQGASLARPYCCAGVSRTFGTYLNCLPPTVAYLTQADHIHGNPTR